MGNYQQAVNIYRYVAKKRDLYLQRPALFLIKNGITANSITIARLFLVVPMFFAVGVSPTWAALIIFINYYVLDAIDGVVARASHTSGEKGRVLDLCVDHFYVIPLVLALICYRVVDGFWGAFYLVFLTIDYFATFIRFGVAVGKYPFKYSKFLVYILFLVWILGWGNYFDLGFVFLAIVLLGANINHFIHLFDDY